MFNEVTWKNNVIIYLQNEKCRQCQTDGFVYDYKFWQVGKIRGCHIDFFNIRGGIGSYLPNYLITGNIIDLHGDISFLSKNLLHQKVQVFLENTRSIKYFHYGKLKIAFQLLNTFFWKDSIILTVLP